jgi:hypothetical protein
MSLAVKLPLAREKNKPSQRLTGKSRRRVQELVHRRAMSQLLRVPTDDFCQSQQEYLDWESFSLWVRAVVGAEGRVPLWMTPVLRERCPGFLEHAQQWRIAHPKKALHLPHLLLEWIHDHIFARVKQDGWLDALIFYSVRDSYSQCTWAHCEECEDEWSHIRPARYPSFDEWRRAVGRTPFAAVAGGKQLSDHRHIPSLKRLKR